MMKSKRISLHINNLVALHNFVFHSLENKKQIFIQKINLMRNLLHKPHMRSHHHVSLFYQLKSNCIVQRLIQIVNVLHRNHLSDLWRVAEEEKTMSEQIKEQLQFTRLISYCSISNFPAHISLLKSRNRLSMVSKISSHD